MVEVMFRYSNHQSVEKTLRTLMKLPQKRIETVQIAHWPPLHEPTTAERTQITNRYQTGETIRSIANDLAFHRETVSTVLHHANIQTRYHHRTPIDLDHVNELRSQGLTLNRIAEIIGTIKSTLVRARRRSLE